MTRTSFRIALAQLDPTMGDVDGNLALARTARAEAAAQGADVIAFTELFLAGYPAEDLVLKPAFQDACRAALERLARETADGGPAVLIGLPFVEAGSLYNSYALLDEGQVVAVRHKVDLPKLRPLRREARVRGRPPARPGDDSRRARRHPDLRGHLGGGGRRVPRRDRGGALRRAQRLAP